MLRINLLVLVILSSSLVFASDLKQQYKIVSDHIDTSLAPGVCLIKGTVKNGNIPVENGLVGVTVSGKDTKTDSAGFYELYISPSDSILYFYKPFMEEIAIAPYDFKEGHVVIIDFYAREKVRHEVMKKPVIYLYPEANTETEVSINPKGNITFTYPETVNSWKGIASSDGKFAIGDKSYPYLFWEAEGDITFNVDNHTVAGATVLRSDVIKFLETSLDGFGLNDIEKTDFITYWGPIMMKHDACLVQFLTNEIASEKIGSLTISPQPDHVNRLYMIITSSENHTYNVVAPETNFSFNREGFDVLEWGGTEITRVGL